MIDIEELDLWNQPDEGDPLVWIRKHRDELAKKYPTFEERREYYKQVGTIEDAKARIQERIAEKRRLGLSSTQSYLQSED